jgi:hypothetical protein
MNEAFNLAYATGERHEQLPRLCRAMATGR